jgi:hypothetical protein
MGPTARQDPLSQKLGRASHGMVTARGVARQTGLKV